MPGPAGPSPKLLGRLAAVVMALVFGGIVWWSMSRNSAPTSTGPAPIGDDEVPDITEMIPGAGESIVITLADQNDPGRVAGIIEVDRFDPIGNGERELLNPRGWLYPKDGRVIRVRADRGVLLMQGANSSPESGTLEGDVRVLVYEGSPAPGVPPTDDATPMVTATFEETVRFETRYLRFSTPGAFNIESDQITFDGIGLAVMLNGVRDRLELIDVDRGGRMEIRVAGDGEPDPSSTQETADSPAATPGGPVSVADGSAPATGEPAPIKIDLYQATLQSEVVATLGTTRVEGDRLELFTRLRDNTLSQEAFTPVGFGRSAPRARATGETKIDADGTATSEGVALTVDGASGEMAPGIEPGPTGAGDTLVLVWQGPMTIRPLGDGALPDELAEDDAAIALFGDEERGVRFRDDARGVDGRAGGVRYAATRGVFTLESDATPVEAVIANAGRGTFDRVDANLVTGVIALTGPGAGEAESGATLAWQDSGELTLAVDDNGDLTDRLTGAAFSGGVLAEQREGVIESERLETRFGVGSDGRSALRSATITNGSISAEPDEFDRPRSLAGASIRMDFTGDADAPQPVRVEAIGDSTTQAHARANGSSLFADRAVASLATDDAGALFVRTADASGSISFTGENDTRASGVAMNLDGANERIRITGTGSAVAQGDSSIEGTDIRLDARNRRMDVEGAGRFTHTLRDERGVDAGRVLASWQRSMRFDDALGRLVCLGDVSVTAARDAYSRDKLDAGRIEVEMTPRLSPSRLGQPERARREVTVARAFGGSSADGDRPARAETQRYDPANPEFAEGLLYLEGDQIIADTERSELRVPGAGTLLVLDRRQDDAPDADDSPSFGPGLTRFTWEGSLTLDRTQGVAVMSDSVFVRHKPVGGEGAGSSLVDLVCDTLTARFGEGGVASTVGSSDARGVTLDMADASGNVVFVAGGKRLEADGAKYDAASEILHALASPGRLVTLTEPGTAAPVSARSMRWDLARDQIEINKPSPVVLPNR